MAKNRKKRILRRIHGKCNRQNELDQNKIKENKLENT